VLDPAAVFLQPWVVYCDGSAVPNPGRMGLGAVIIAPDGTRSLLSMATDSRGCNNEAEARALIAALRELRALGATALQIHCDSSLLVEQLGPTAMPPVARLAFIYAEAGALLKTFAHTSLQWIPRHRNGEADALARAALGLPPKRLMKLTKRRR
jgi:ribonuclease HI